jgi:hypothetical protein
MLSKILFIFSFSFLYNHNANVAAIALSQGPRAIRLLSYWLHKLWIGCRGPVVDPPASYSGGLGFRHLPGIPAILTEVSCYIFSALRRRPEGLKSIHPGDHGTEGLWPWMSRDRAAVFVRYTMTLNSSRVHETYDSSNEKASWYRPAAHLKVLRHSSIFWT